jgi:hypothetical protein
MRMKRLTNAACVDLGPARGPMAGTDHELTPGEIAKGGMG